MRRRWEDEGNATRVARLDDAGTSIVNVEGNRAETEKTLKGDGVTTLVQPISYQRRSG